MNLNLIDWEYLNVVWNIVFHVFIVFIISFSGALVSDVWFYKKDNEPMNPVQDVVVGIVFGVVITLLDNFTNIDAKVSLALAFFLGMFGIEILAIVLQPKFLISFIKNLSRNVSDSKVVEALRNTADDLEIADTNGTRGGMVVKFKDERPEQTQELVEIVDDEETKNSNNKGNPEGD